MTARASLRDLTRPAHEVTDAAFSALDLTRRGDYRLFLHAHLLAWSALEPVFAEDLPEGLRPPAMSDTLAADLASFGEQEPVQAPPSFAEDAMGAAYVVAGSHFGQKVLSRRHARSEDDAVRMAGRYLSSPALARYWPVLRKALEDTIRTPERLDAIAKGAEATFSLFVGCLDIARRQGAPHEFA